MISRIKNLIIIIFLMISFPIVGIAGDFVKPFILIAPSTGELSTVTAEVKDKLSKGGFEIVGEYSPYPAANVVIVSHAVLKLAATKSKRGGYGAVMRVSITSVKNTVEIAYSNPLYWANAYRMSSDLDVVSAAFLASLGSGKPFGSGDKNLTKNDMREYHYTFMMEYFDDPSELAEYSDHVKATKMVEKSLAAKVAGSEKVYRIDLGKDSEGKAMTLFGVALRGVNTDDCSSDQFIMSRIDKSKPRHSAHLPYELLVYGSTIEALYARFRIALSWPHLPMMTSETGATFMSIMCSPGAIEDTLKRVAGAKHEEGDDDEY